MDCGSLLAIEQLTMKQIRRATASAPASSVFRPPGDFGGSRAASEKRQQAAAVQGLGLGPLQRGGDFLFDDG